MTCPRVQKDCLSLIHITNSHIAMSMTCVRIHLTEIPTHTIVHWNWQHYQKISKDTQPVCCRFSSYLQRAVDCKIHFKTYPKYIQYIIYKDSFHFTFISEDIESCALTVSFIVIMYSTGWRTALYVAHTVGVCCYKSLCEVPAHVYCVDHRVFISLLTCSPL